MKPLNIKLVNNELNLTYENAERTNNNNKEIN